MSDGQLELFDLTSHDTPRPRRDTLGRLLLNLRYDQLALACVGMLLALTVVFAGGVERGKHLARAERLGQPQEEPARALSKNVRSPVSEPIVVAPVISTPKAPEPARQPASSSRPRYAVQVRTYSQPQLAKMELNRLHAKGESAFLIIREGRTAVYVGPFPSRNDATEKVALLRSRYQDCFVKSL